MKQITIDIQRKAWGAPTTVRGDNVLAFTSRISREADNYGALLNGSLPEEYATIALLTRRNRLLTVVMGQGAFTRFDGMGRSYNMRVVYETPASELAVLQRPLASLLPRLDAMREYDVPGNQVESAVSVDVLPEAPLTALQARLQQAIVAAMLAGRQLYVRLPEEDKCYGDAVRTGSRHLPDFIAAIDSLPATLRLCAGLVFAVDTAVPAFRDLMAQSLVVAHFDEVKPADNVTALRLENDALVGNTKPVMSLQRLARIGKILAARDVDETFDKEKILAEFRSLATQPLPDNTNRAGRHDDTDTPAIATVEPEPQPDASDEPQAGEGETGGKPLPAWASKLLIALVSFVAGIVVGHYGIGMEQPASPDVEVSPRLVMEDSTQSLLVEHLQYDFAATSRFPALAGDTTCSANVLDEHPMASLAAWNLPLLFRSNDVKVAFSLTMPDTVYTDSVISQPITKQRISRLNREYYEALKRTGMDDNFATGVRVVLTDNPRRSYTISPDSTFLSLTARVDAQVAQLIVGDQTFEFDNTRFAALNQGTARGLFYPVYYLWAVSQMDSIRRQLGTNKFYAY